MLSMLPQYSPAAEPAGSAGWSTPARYRLAFASLALPLTSAIGSMAGTSASGLAGKAFAWISSSASEVDGVLLSPRLGAVHGLQPSAGSTKLSSRPLSRGLEMVTAPAIAAAFAAVLTASVPFAVARYAEVTLSLWSWSIRAKARVVRQGWPSVAVPGFGTVTMPPWLPALTA